MKVAVLADVHANLPALVAVLEDLPNVDCIACLGDVVGYYADPNEVCALMRQHKIITIRGNHDAYVLGERLPHSDRVEAYRTAWTREVLEPRNFGWLRSLPTSMECRWGKIVAHLHHATPWNDEAYLYPDSDQLNEIKLGPNEFLALGHTHRPMLRQCGEGFVLNPGSVGQPRDCNPLASYAILDCDTANVDFRRARYDVTSLQRRLRELGWEPSTIAILSRTERQGETSNPARSGDRKQHHK
jgi:putative phosphoesterase